MTALPPPDRVTALAEAAAAAGALWAQSCRESLRREGRRVAGGWPGTLSEARGYVRVGGMHVGLSHDELSWVARIVYDSARRDWLAARDSAEE